MLIKRLFRFGYETPSQAVLNSQHGSDDESSSALWIASETEEDAMSWGRAVADAFVASLFVRKKQTAYSWKEAGFAHWLENDPSVLEASIDFAEVEIGEMPDFSML